MTTPTPATIARGLSSLQTTVLVTHPPDREFRPPGRREFDAARLLVSKRLFAWCAGHNRGFVLLPLGAQVRAILEQEAAHE